jgi:hypothetical protein
MEVWWWVFKMGCCSGKSLYSSTVGTYGQGGANYSTKASFSRSGFKDNKDPLEEIRQFKLMSDIYQQGGSKGLYSSNANMPTALDRANDPGNKGSASSSVYDLGAVLYRG